MSLPGFLIIGAMKSGSTTLFDDLRTNPALFLDVKEPDLLSLEEVEHPDGLARYQSLFANAQPHQLCGEASTSYTKHPKHIGAPQRAKQVLGENLKLIYILREPVARAVSQHYHVYFWNNEPRPMNQVPIDQLDEHIIDFSCYGRQLALWLEEYPLEQILILRFEEFIKDRVGHYRKACAFLEVEPREDLLEIETKSNQTAGKPIYRGVWARLAQNQFYLGRIKGRLPASLKQWALRRFFPKAPPPAPPTLEQVDFLIDALREDAERLRVLLGEDEPLWDFEQVRQQYAKLNEATPPSAS